jgi:hypothetical protein
VIEFEIKGEKYKTVRKLDAKRQYHVARRIAPAILALASAAEVINFSADGVPRIRDQDEAGAIQPLVQALASMKDEDVDYILFACLSIVQRQQVIGGKEVWANIQAANGALAFEDIEMATMMQIVVQVIQENLANFFSAPSEPPAEATAGSQA